jgi:NADPH:quinone reductase-like Zn-dependent oxidoreductase
MMFSSQVIPETMRALVYDAGGPDKLAWKTMYKVPRPGKREVLIRVEAASLNPFDVQATESQHLFLRSKGLPVGRDVAGTVVAIGAGVSHYAVGDKVFGLAPGCAQYTVADVQRIVKIPGDVELKDYGVMGFAGVVAHQVLARHWFDRPEYTARTIVIIGASGGVGMSPSMNLYKS